MINKILQGDCLIKLKKLDDNSVDSIVTDPPYELGFMGKSWDNTGIANNKDMWAECLRVLKPGGHLLAFSGTRTYHRMACAIEDAGFEVRDMIEYIYGSGFPKSLNIQKHLLKKYGYGNMEEYETTQQKTKSQMQDLWKATIHQTLVSQKDNDRGALQDLLEDLDKGTQHKIFTHTRSESKIIPFSERQRQSCLERWSDIPTPQGELHCKCQICEMPTGVFVNGKKRWVCYGTQTNNGETSWEVIDENGVCSSYKSPAIGQSFGEFNVVCEQCDAQAIRGTGGFGTALKPAHEPICMARKPLAEKTVAENVLKYGTGGINIDESRVGTEEMSNHGGGINQEGRKYGNGVGIPALERGMSIATGRFPANLIHDNSEEVRECFPETKSGNLLPGHKRGDGTGNSLMGGGGIVEGTYGGDSGNASRFFKSIIYQAKASKSERKKGLDSIVLVDILRVWNENNTTKEKKLIRLMVTGISPQKVIGESGVQLKNANEWNTCLFGKHLMEKYQEDIKSITKTETNSITTSQILNWLIHLLTNEYIVGANLEMENGGNLVANAENSNTLTITINEAMALALGVKDVVSGMQLKINVKEGSNIHSTVKPIALMEYLIKMITPKGGIVLDPFAGSGSTLVAAKQNGYQYIGIEMTPEYLPIIEARLNSVPTTLFTNVDK